MVSEEEIRRLKKQFFISIVLVMLVVFSLGILIGKYMESGSLGTIQKFIQENELNTESYVLEQEFMENFDDEGCLIARSRLDGLHGEIYNIGKILDDPNAREELGEENFVLIKRRFHLMQARIYLLQNRLKTECQDDSEVILFYYSIGDDRSIEQGLILDSLVAKRDVKVFAIEYNYSRELNFLERSYGVRETPSMVINFEKVHSGLISGEEIEADLDEREENTG